MLFRFGAMVDTGPQFGPNAKMLEDHGFDFIYSIDSPIVWRDMGPSLAHAALSTDNLLLGACVTNPVSRNPVVTASYHASLHELSGGRVFLGMGRGDSALRRIGEKQASLKDFKERVSQIHRLANGEEVMYEPVNPGNEDWHAQGSGPVPVRFEWAIEKKIPLYVAGYGPKVTAWAGEVADGVFIQIAEPDTCRWIIENVRRAAEKVGRDPNEIDFVCCAPTALHDDLHEACNLTRGFPAFVANHVADLARNIPKSSIPENFLKCLENHEIYDYQHHTDSAAQHASNVSDELADAYSIVGTAEKCLEKLRLLQRVGITNLCIYFMGFDQKQIESTVKIYRDKIISNMR